MKRINKKTLFFWSIFIAAAIFRVWQTFGVKPPSIGPCVKQVVTGGGHVNEEPEINESGQILVVQVDSMSVASSTVKCGSDFLVRIKTKPYPQFKFDDLVSFKGKLLKPINFSSNDPSGRSFDYEGYLAKSDIFYEMKSAQISLITVSVGESASLPPALGSLADTFPTLILKKVTSTLYSLKRQFVTNLKKTLGEPHAALASGLVVGEKAALGNDLINDFRTVGLIHIVVLSGYNITIVGAAMRRMLMFLPRVWGISIGGIGIALFGILVGGGATVVRSCFMAGIALSADIIRREYNVTRALVFAGLIMLIQSPMILLHDPSFQLSFLATTGLILLASPVESRLGFITDKFGLRSVISATIATQIFVSPYILYMMGNLSVVGVVVNILVLPFIPITMLFVFLTGAIGMISLPVAQVFAWGTHILLSYELFMVQWFAKLPFAAIHLPIFSKWWVVGFYVVFAVVFWGRRVFSLFKSARGLNDVQQTPDVYSLFEEFRRVSKGVLIDRPNEMISIDLELCEAILSFVRKEADLVFTRRSLKHLSEKGSSGKSLLLAFQYILKRPDAIYKGRNNRILVVKSTKGEKEGESYVIVIELKDYKAIIITSYIAKEKYLKNFEILWRTAAS